MRPVLHLSLVVLVGVCATWAYRVNYATQSALGRKADIRAAIAAEREAIGVLAAEWAYLNRPDRLRALVEANAATLQLMDLAPGHFGEIASIAYPAPAEPPPASPFEPLFEGLDESIAEPLR